MQLLNKSVRGFPPGQGAKREFLSLIQLLLPGAISKREKQVYEPTFAHISIQTEVFILFRDLQI